MTPQKVIDDNRMSALQYIVVGLMIGLNALDGFDVLAISFAAPGIAEGFQIDRAALGIVLSAELVGMAVGSILLGGVADKIGRRPTILACLVVMTAGMFLASTAASISTLLVWRVITGLGIGGMLAAINAVAAEFSNQKNRNICLALMVIGYPIGAVIGGSVVSFILANGGTWQNIFHFGGVVTAIFLPLVFFFVPESVGYIQEKRGPNALERINATLARMKHATLDALPAADPHAPKATLADIFKPGLLGTTIMVTFAYFAHIVTFYFILKWIPKIVVDMGYAPSSAADVLVWANIGGATGGAIFGVMAARFGLKPMTLIVLVISTLAVSWFGRGASDIQQLAMTAAFVGLFTNSGVVGLYTIFARAFPTHVRATGTGFAIGIGRGGSALAPMAAGFLFHAGMNLQTVAIIMGSGATLAALALLGLKLRDEPATPVEEHPTAA